MVALAAFNAHRAQPRATHSVHPWAHARAIHRATHRAGALAFVTIKRLVSTSAAALMCLCAPAMSAQGGQQTVCTITVNSADEKQAFRRHLPESKYRFVELVERGRPDWLASACQARVACDVLIISGHYDGGNEFFSDQLESSEFLPVDELERVSCSDSCPGLFTRLKEVHLFGCNTLNPHANSSSSAEIMRSLVREGHTLKEAKTQWQALNAKHGESSRDRMRLVFKDVPVIYGFSSVAPLGPVAAASLERFFRAGGARDVAQGRSSSRLLQQFSSFGMSVTRGMTDNDPNAAVRRDVCQFADDRLSDVDKLGFVHQLLQRPVSQTRVHLDRIQRFAKTLEDPQRRTPKTAEALARIAADGVTRTSFLAFARDADEPAVRARLLSLALDLGWLSDEARWDELGLMLGELQARPVLGVTEVDLACTLNQQHELDGAFVPVSALDIPHAAVKACLGSAEGRTRTLQGLVSSDIAEVQIAQAYLRHRPISDAAELRRVAAEVVNMSPSDAQVRALESLGRHYVADRSILDLLIGLYSQTSSAAVQAAVAGILIRADKRSIASPELVLTLVKDRRPSPPGDNMVDALLRRLRSS